MTRRDALHYGAILTIILVLVCVSGWVDRPRPRIAPVLDKPRAAAVSAGKALAEPELVSLGTFKLTYYCSCSRCCGQWADGITATGTEATEGRTIAVDPSVIPLGSTVVIGGRTYIAEDTGAAGYHIDVYMESHAACLQAGVGYEEVWIKNEHDL